MSKHQITRDNSLALNKVIFEVISPCLHASVVIVASLFVFTGAPGCADEMSLDALRALALSREWEGEIAERAETYIF